MYHQIAAGELQQLFATLYGAEEGVVWDLYTIADKDLLEKKLEFLIPDLKHVKLEEKPFNPLDEDEKQKQINKVGEINKELAGHRAKLFDALWAQRKYNNCDLIMSIIFVLVIPDEGIENTDSVKKQKTFSCHPVFRIQKCKVYEDSENCCVVFVDEIGRVYQNWQDYVNNNTLPEGIMLAPESGFYKFNGANEVCLMAKTTPKASVEQKILKGIDVAANFISSATIINLALPWNRGTGIGSLVLGIGAGLWSTGRFIEELADRDNHEESISLENEEGRSAWLGLADNLLGMGAISALNGLNLAILDGRNITNAVKIAVTGVKIASGVMSGVKICDSVITHFLKKRDDETISAEEINQLKTSLATFTHSLYNFKLISELQMFEEAGTMQEFRRNLAEAQKHIYNDLGSASAAMGDRGNIIRQPGIIPVDDSINFGKNAKRIAEKYIQIVIKNKFLTNQEQFKFCIMEMLKNLNETAIDKLFNIAKSFLEPTTSSNPSVSSIPFEHVLWRLYIIVKTMNSNPLETIGKNRKERRALLAELKKVYKNKNEDNITFCNKCGGYYSMVAVE